MAAINEVIKMPVLRPVCCYDKIEIIDLAKRIGTYDVSIRPFQDCCTIFVPEHPVINPEIEKAREYEQAFDFETLINEAVKNIKDQIRNPEKKIDVELSNLTDSKLKEYLQKKSQGFE